MKKVFIILLIAITLISVSSCKKEENEKTVTFWWSSSSGSSSTALEEIINDFNNSVGKEKGIKLEGVYQGKANDNLTKIKATSSLPDIALLDATSSLDMISNPSLVTLEEMSFNKEKIIDVALNQYKTEKGTIALPFSVSALLYYYNKTLFDSLSLEAPKTFEELEYSARVIKENSSYPVLTAFPSTYEVSIFIGQNNGYIINNENGHEKRGDKVVFQDSYRTFLEKLKSLYDTGAMELSTTGNDDFVSGRTASILASSSNLSTLLKSIDNSFTLGVSTVPKLDSTSNCGTIPSGSALYTFSKGESVKVVLEYLSSKEVQIKWAEITGYIPVNKDAYEDETYLKFLEKDPLYSIAPKEILSSSPLLRSLWVPSAYTIYGEFQKNISNVLNEKITIEEGVKEMTEVIQKALDEN